MSRQRRPTTSPTDEFSPNHYWEGRLRETWAIEGVGLKDHGRRFNEILYKVRRAVFLKEIESLPLNVASSSILDVGSGTGFYVDLWRAVGARSVTGSDLTRTAVENLSRRHPDLHFVQLDIGAPDVALAPASFDIISAFDVFFHIVDDDHFSQALSNIAFLLKPGGWVLFSDALLTHPPPNTHGWPEPHVRWRTEQEVRRLLTKYGFLAGNSRAVFVLLNDPTDSTSRLRRISWAAISRLARASELSGALVAGVLYPVERLLLMFTRSAPTTKMLAAQLTPDASSPTR